MTHVYRGPCAWEEDPGAHAVCPFDCPSETAIKKHGVESTLVGWLGSAEKDPNHHTMRCTCDGCGKDFSKEWHVKSKNIWYSKGSYVLMGKPGCCKSSYYCPCECGGWMIHSTRSQSSKSGLEITYLTPKGSIPAQPMFWACSRCKKKGPDDQYGWNYVEAGGKAPTDEERAAWAKEPSRKLKFTWTSAEEPTIISGTLVKESTFLVEGDQKP